MGKLFIQSFIFIIGFMVLAAGASNLYKYFNYRFWGETTYGFVDHPSSGRGLGGRPLIHYKDSSGAKHEFKSVAKTHWFHRPKTGEKIKIYIKKSEPQRAIVDSLFFYLFFPTLCVIVGSYCCIYAILFHKEQGGGADQVPF